MLGLLAGGWRVYYLLMRLVLSAMELKLEGAIYLPGSRYASRATQAHIGR